MSTNDGGFFPEMGARLKSERKRLGFSQEALCKLIGVKDPKTLRSWESGATAPTLFDLAEFVSAGADLIYIVSGDRAVPAVTMERTAYERSAYRVAAAVAEMALSQEDAELLLAMARRLAKPGHE